jgi:hypothetical protein
MPCLWSSLSSHLQASRISAFLSLCQSCHTLLDNSHSQLFPGTLFRRDARKARPKHTTPLKNDRCHTKFETLGRGRNFRQIPLKKFPFNRLKLLHPIKWKAFYIFVRFWRVFPNFRSPFLVLLHVYIPTIRSRLFKGVYSLLQVFILTLEISNGDVFLLQNCTIVLDCGFKEFICIFVVLLNTA